LKVYRNRSREQTRRWSSRFQLGKAVHRPYRRGVISIQEKCIHQITQGIGVCGLSRRFSRILIAEGIVQFDFDVAQPLEQLLVLRRLPDRLSRASLASFHFSGAGRCRRAS